MFGCGVVVVVIMIQFHHYMTASVILAAVAHGFAIQASKPGDGALEILDIVFSSAFGVLVCQ